MKKEMKRKIDHFIDQILRSVYKINEAGFALAIPVLFNLLFIFFYGAVIGRFIARETVNNMYSLGAAITQSQDLAGTGIIRSIVFSLFLAVLLLFAIYSLLEGASWRMSKIFATKDTISYADYLKRFSFVNVFWLIPFIAYSLASFMIKFKYARIIADPANSAGFFSNPGYAFLMALLWAFLLAMIYFASISYVLIEKGRWAIEILIDSFETGYKYFKYIAPRAIFAILIFLRANIIVVQTMRISKGLMVLLGVVILLPMLTWMKVYMHMVVDEKGRTE
jgi:hypothetical protein